MKIEGASKPLAKESIKTHRTRERLKKKLQSLEKSFTSNALEQKKIEIHQWLDRHAPERIPLKSKKVSSPDSHQKTAEMSQKVSALASKIQKELFNKIQ